MRLIILLVIVIVVIIAGYFLYKKYWEPEPIIIVTPPPPPPFSDKYFTGFMEYENMYYIYIVDESGDQMPLPGHYIHIPVIDPHGVYEVARDRSIPIPQAVNPNTYGKIVGSTFKACPILRSGGDRLTPADQVQIQSLVNSPSRYYWDYIAPDVRSIPESWFKKDKQINQYFDKKIYRLMDDI